MINERQLSKVVALVERANMHKSYLRFKLIQFQAVNLTLLYDVKLLAFLPFLQNKLVFLEGQRLQAVNEFQLLVLIQFI